MKTLATKAVKKYCLECMNGNSKEVELCPSDTCPLYKYRFGDKSGATRRAIKTKCEGCMEMPNRCEFTDCPLHPYRLD